MKFNSMNDLYLWLSKYKSCCFDSGAQGTCYKIRNQVFKIFNEFIDIEYMDDLTFYSREEILKFQFVDNKTYVFPSDVIMVGDIVIGYIMPYIKGHTIDKINPLTIDLDRFELDLAKVYPDIEIISNFGIRSFDVIYNIMYGVDGFRIIDTTDYNYSLENFENLFKINARAFNIGIEFFLVDGYFDEFVKSSKYLMDMYTALDIDICSFLKEFRKALSINEGHGISRLCDAKKSLILKARDERKYIRQLP